VSRYILNYLNFDIDKFVFNNELIIIICFIILHLHLVGQWLQTKVAYIIIPAYASIGLHISLYNGAQNEFKELKTMWYKVNSHRKCKVHIAVSYLKTHAFSISN